MVRKANQRGNWLKVWSKRDHDRALHEENVLCYAIGYKDYNNQRSGVSWKIRTNAAGQTSVKITAADLTGRAAKYSAPVKGTGYFQCV